MADEREHLQFLSMFYFAVGALAAMVSLVPALALFVAVSMRPPGGPIPLALAEGLGLPWAGTAAAALLLAGFAFFALMAGTATRLRQCRSYRFCVAVAWLACCFVPAGTILGAVTLPILRREATRRLFARGASSSAPVAIDD